MAEAEGEGAGTGACSARVTGATGAGESTFRALACCRRLSISSSARCASSSSSRMRCSRARRSSIAFLCASSCTRNSSSSADGCWGAGLAAGFTAGAGVAGAVRDFGGGGAGAFFIEDLMGAGGAVDLAGAVGVAAPPEACCNLALREASRSSCSFSACLAFSSASFFSRSRRSSTDLSTVGVDGSLSGTTIPRARIRA